MHRDELIAKLRLFTSNPIVERYRSRDLAGKSPKELLAFTVNNTIYRAFHHEAPSLRYERWRWHARAEQLGKELNAISSQMAFDRFTLELGESLVAEHRTLPITQRSTGYFKRWALL
jgi:hypothetical protein